MCAHTLKYTHNRKCTRTSLARALNHSLYPRTTDLKQDVVALPRERHSGPHVHGVLSCDHNRVCDSTQGQQLLPALKCTLIGDGEPAPDTPTHAVFQVTPLS
jgi:hypothetical protein